MDSIKDVFRKPIVKKFLLLGVMCLFLYLTRSLITLYLLTFIFIYLINEAQKFIYRHVHKFIPIARSFIIVFIYIVAITVIVLFICAYAPKVVRESGAVIKSITISVKELMNTTNTGNGYLNLLLTQVKKVDLSEYFKSLVSVISNISSLSVSIFFSLILSLFFLLQKARIYKFMGKFSSSKLAWICDDVKFFGSKFTNTFGKVIQTQILISFINCILSIIMLWIMRFPNVLGLGFMIFILGIIPVAGVFISLLPLSLIAYSIGGWQHVIYILIMIAILHTLESYILNPKLMSDKTKLPIFFTFLILIVSEHFFGLWGLLVGIPIFVFLLDILDVNLQDTSPKFPNPALLKSKIKDTVKSEIAASKVVIDNRKKK